MSYVKIHTIMHMANIPVQKSSIRILARNSVVKTDTIFVYLGSLYPLIFLTFISTVYLLIVYR